MSSSKGRIFIGQSGLVMDEVEFTHRQKMEQIWDEETEKRFIEKIKQKATQQAKAIVEEAKTEALEIKRRAYEEGYKQGKEDAQKEIESLKTETSQRLISILKDIESQKAKIWEQFSEDLLILIDTCVKKVLTVSFEEHKKKVLESLLSRSLDLVEEKREIVLALSEEDRGLLEEILKEVRKDYPHIQKWNIEWRTDIPSGSVIIETRDSRIEDSFKDRMEQVLTLLDEISSP